MHQEIEELSAEINDLNSRIHSLRHKFDDPDDLKQTIAPVEINVIEKDKGNDKKNGGIISKIKNLVTTDENKDDTRIPLNGNSAIMVEDIATKELKASKVLKKLQVGLQFINIRGIRVISIMCK